MSRLVGDFWSRSDNSSAGSAARRFLEGGAYVEQNDVLAFLKLQKFLLTSCPASLVPGAFCGAR